MIPDESFARMPILLPDTSSRGLKPRLRTWFATLAIVGILAGPAAATDLKVGGIGIVKPTYEGSERYEVVGAPFIFPVFGSSDADGGAFSVNGADDVRLRLIREHGIEAGILGGYAFGRDQDDGDLLDGLGDVDGGFIAGAFVGYRLGPVLFDVSYHHIVSGDTGGFFRVGAAYKRQVSSQLTIKTRVGATYADDDYMANYFGITDRQSMNSVEGLVTYDTDAGFKDVHFGLTATYAIDRHWSLIAGAGYKRLIGDAADSPIVETEDQFSAKLGVTYRFSISR